MCKSRTGVRLGKNNGPVEISDCIENRREMEDDRSVPVGSPVGQNEPPVPTGSLTQPREPIGDGNWITSLALERADCAVYEKTG
jgi:hypothetical protein